VTLSVAGKRPGAGFEPQGEDLSFSVQAGEDMRPYDRLIGAALDGDNWLFARQDTVEAAWNVVDPLPILANAKRSDEENEEDVDPLEKLFGRARAAIRGTRAQETHEVEKAQPDSASPPVVEDKPAQPEAATA